MTRPGASGGRPTTLLFMLLLLAGSVTGAAATAQVDELSGLSLEDLLDLEVVTATRKQQRISAAPAIVTVITAEEIDDLGVQTLPELMRFVPGMTVEDTYWRGPIITARGVAMTLYNDKILLLIDGVPAYEAVTLEYYLDTVPVTAIERIEVIRGPGSALYGTNAFSAVINVITAAPARSPGLRAFVKAGSFNTRGFGFTFAEQRGELGYRISATMTDGDGYDHVLAADERGVSDINLNYENDIQNLHARLHYKGLQLAAGYYFQNIAKFSMTTAIAFGADQMPDAGKAEHTKYYVNAAYEFRLSDRLDGRVVLHYDWMDKETGVGQFGAINFANLLLGDETYPLQLDEVDPSFAAPNYSLYEGQVYQADLQLAYRHSESLEVLAGFDAEVRDVEHVYTMLGERDGRIIPTHEGATDFPPDNAFDYGAYLQVDGKLSQRLGYVAGVRLSSLDLSDATFLTPRLGLVCSFSDALSAKLLYGKAYRGPGFQEEFFRVHGVTYGAAAAGRNLDPEQIETLEAAVDFSLAESHVFRVNAFVLRTSDLILRRPIAGSPDEEVIGHGIGLIYDNFGRQEIAGLELEAKGSPGPGLRYFANFSYREGTDEELGEDLPYFVNTTASAGITFKPTRWLSLSPNLQYVGDQDGRLGTGTRPPYQDGQPVHIDDYMLFNGVVKVELSERLSLKISGHNLFDESYTYPERIRRFIPELPGGPGRSFYLSLQYRESGE